MSPEQNPNFDLNLRSNEPAKTAGAEPEFEDGLVNKTPLMLKVEQKFARGGESIGQLLKRLYVEEGLLLTDIRRLFNADGDFNIRQQSLQRWMKRLNPGLKVKKLGELRSLDGYWERHKTGLQAFWNDPAKKKQALDKIHSQEAEEKRRKTLQEHWSEHPELKAEVGKRLAKARADAYLEVKKKVPKHLIESFINKGFVPGEIARELALWPKTVGRLIGEYQIKMPKKRKSPGIEELNLRVQMVEKAKIEGSFGRLTPREQEVLSGLYPINQTAPTQQKIAADLHICRERVRQLDNSGLEKLNKSPKKTILNN